MCTLSWIRGADGYELFFNRDERHTRRPALLPAVRSARGVDFVAPLDGDFGGSWIAVNAHGLALCLLNGYTDRDLREIDDARAGFVSRGLLLTGLIDAATSAAVQVRLRDEDLSRYRSFWLAALEPGGTYRLARWEHGSLELRELDDASMPLVSSSFDTDEVRRSRIALFRDWSARRATDAPSAHAEFHASHLPERGPRSVCMHRPEAATVCYSNVQVDPAEVRFFHAAHPPCLGLADPEPVTLARATG